MLEPILAEDSTYTKLVPSLEGILKDLDEKATHHDYLVALVIVLLAEAGFYLSPPDSDRSKRPKLRSLHIPKDWKSQETGIYQLYFQLQDVPDIICKLVAIPLGDTLILNFFPLMEGKTTYTMFKDTLSTPVRTDVLIKAKVMGPSLQTIPTELKLRILRMLDTQSLTKMAQCCLQFYQLCSQTQLGKVCC
ncbi:uncharacterized protein LOC143425854 isoform X2 [Xylocopa sonorina]|uniref:uncharacterized protein LOC143425854 isoform X2 n=1 Tax=Xylocopa sonorina TaxID=1818115 RepID=UPI00403AAF01